MTKQVIGVSGMMCGHCEAAVADAVRKLPGVKKAKANRKKSEAVVEYDEALVTLDSIRDAIKETGYEVA
ncbi:MAG: copper ion binding protein [Lachnospiraceae bacterium]|jgi:Cu2+-exporting ATPase|nr:copper ion binding protein [Lachnospiraceae bacterium]